MFHLIWGFYKYWYSCFVFFMAFLAKIARTFGVILGFCHDLLAFWYWFSGEFNVSKWILAMCVCVIGSRLAFRTLGLRRLGLDLLWKPKKLHTRKLVSSCFSVLVFVFKIEWNKWSNSRIGLSCSRFSFCSRLFRGEQCRWIRFVS